MVVSVKRQDGSVKTVKIGTILALLGVIAALSGFIGNTLAWVGYRGDSPNERFAALARTDTVQMRRQDQLEAKLDYMNRLQLQMAALRCLDPKDAANVRQAQLPCGRIIRELDIEP